MTVRVLLGQCENVAELIGDCFQHPISPTGSQLAHTHLTAFPIN
jgi:hypothetical protein